MSLCPQKLHCARLALPVSKTQIHTHTQETSEKSKKDDNTDFPEDLYATKPGVHARDDNVVLVRVRRAHVSRIELLAHLHELSASSRTWSSTLLAWTFVNHL